MFYDEKADYLRLLPERLREVREFSALAEAIEQQLEKLNGRIKDMAENKAISASDESGVLRWEKMLGVSSPLNSTLKARREALTAKLMTKPPINLKVLKDIVETYMGLEVDVSVKGYTVRVKYRGESRISDLIPLYVTIYEAIPANMLLNITYRYVNWEELDGLGMVFDELDEMAINWNEFDKGEWI